MNCPIMYRIQQRLLRRAGAFVWVQANWGVPGLLENDPAGGAIQGYQPPTTCTTLPSCRPLVVLPVDMVPSSEQRALSHMFQVMLFNTIS